MKLITRLFLNNEKGQLFPICCPWGGKENTSFLWGVTKTIYIVLGGFYKYYYNSISRISVHKLSQILHSKLFNIYNEIFIPENNAK